MDSSEQLIADSLSRHASDAPPDDRLLAGVHARLRRRRTGRSIGAAVVAAAAVATAITASQSLTARPHPEVAQAPVAGWRWESFKTVEVQVPASWTQYVSGAAPCPAVPGQPVVGRLNDWVGGRGQCTASVLELDERQEYVWFNDLRAPGIEQYDGGWTEETRLVAGVKVSVLTRDDALRERILNTARAIEGTDHYGCTPRQPRGHHSMIDSIDDVTAVDICEYYNGSLVAGSALTSPQTTAFDQALSVVRNFVVSRAGSCPQAPHFFVMTVHTHSTTRLVSFGVSPCRRPTNNVIFWGPHQQPQPLSHPAASPSTR